MDIKEMLHQVRDGALSVEEAEKQLKNLPMRIWATRSWICTGSCVPVSGDGVLPGKAGRVPGGDI